MSEPRMQDAAQSSDQSDEPRVAELPSQPLTAEQEDKVKAGLGSTDPTRGKLATN